MSFNVKAGVAATKMDKKLLLHVHPYSARVMNFISKPDLVPVPSVGVIVNDPDLIRQVFLDKQNYSKIGEGVSSALWTPVIGSTGLLNMDGDAHIKMRRELASSFSQKIIPTLVDEVFKEYVSSYFTILNNGGVLDITTVASEFAYRTLWKLLGFSEDEDDEFSEKTAILRSVTEGIELHRKTLPAGQVKTAKEKLKFIENLVIESYKTPIAGSVIETMKQSGYSSEEVISVAKALMVTGTETVISYIPRMVALFIRSGFMEDLIHHPELLETGLDEAFRVTVPTPVAVRSVTKETILHDKKLLPGQRVILATISACHKGGNFNPYAPINKSLKGLWFGAGTHMCIGLPIAKAQALLVVKELLKTTNPGLLTIVKATSSKRGHTGSYTTLQIKTKKTSS